jgi:hypothetical protein
LDTKNIKGSNKFSDDSGFPFPFFSSSLLPTSRGPSAMGNSPSAPSALETCVRGVLSKGAISVPSDPFYDLNAVKRYNTAYDITPVAVVRPSTTDEVSKVVKCATDNGVKLAG